MSVSIKVCSFNLRVATPVDGENEFCYRLPRILPMLREEAPAIIGFQEATRGMRDELRAALPEYTFLGCGRNPNYRGEAPILAFRNDCFELVSLETFWLSNEPSVPGSSYGGDQSKCPRVTFVARLKHRDSEAILRFYNTHFDHKGAEARLASSRQVLAHIAQSDEPVILTGDLNATPATEEISLLRKSLTEATESLGGTFHGFGRRNPPTKIDYIFTDLPCEGAYLCPDEPVGGIYLSDHFPIVAYVTLP